MGKERTGSMKSPERIMEMRPRESSIFELEALESEFKAGSDSDCSSNNCHWLRLCQTNQHSAHLVLETTSVVKYVVSFYRG